MKIFLLLLIFVGLHGHLAMNIQHHPEAKDPSALRRRLKRSGTYEEPLQVSQKTVYLQTGHTYELPCTVIRPGDSVSVIYWVRGKKLDPAFPDVIISQAYPNDGSNSPMGRYQISSSYGLIIDQVNVNDTNRYWCKTVRKLDSKDVKDYLDVTVVDQTFPEGNDSIVDETSVSLSIESENTIQCPLLPQAPTETDTTVYWSILTDNYNKFGIIFAKFANGDTMLVQEYAATHGPEGNNGLYINRFKRRDERYCCHVFEQGDDLRTACIDVTWLALATERRPTILDCDSTGESCEVEIGPHQDCLHLECSIDDVYPKPSLNWSYTNCKERPTFFTTSSSTENHTYEVFDVQSKVYLVDLQTSFDDCSLVCTAHGEAIPDQTKPASVTIKRLTEASTSQTVTGTFTSLGCNSSGFGFTLFVTIALLVVCLLITAMLICPRSQKCIQTHVGDIPTLPWFPEQCWIPQKESDPLTMSAPSDSSKVPEKDDGEMTPEETAPLMSGEEEDKGVADEKKVCLENRGSEDVDVTDRNFIWNYLGQLITEPAPEVKNMSGFRDIKDVIVIQDGGVVVIDSKGLHLFTVEYHYRFINLYGAFGDKGYICVAHFTDDKLLFGLRWGKLVIFDIANEQVNSFGSVDPVKDTVVQLAGIAVNSSGFVFVSDRKRKIISVCDHDGVCLKRLDTQSIKPGCLALHVRQGALSLFVTSGQRVGKYHITGEKRQSMINHAHHFDIGKETLEKEEFKPGRISVQEDRLLVVNHLQDPGLLELLQLNVNNGKFLHSIIAKAPGIRGVKFISGDRIVLYSGDSVHVFATGDAKQ